jgi:cell shape-determining protein MreC
MRLGRRYRFSKSGYFAVLMLLSVLGILVSPSLSGWLRNLLQPLAPLQDASHRLLAGQAGGAPSLAARPYSDREIEQLEQDVVAWQNIASDLARANQRLHEQLSLLQNLRTIPTLRSCTLVPARVVARDAIPSRDSLLLRAGANRGVQTDDWVATRIFLDVGSEDGVLQDMSVLASEYLIGRIEFVGSFTSRVVLLSDPSVRQRVRIGRWVDGQLRVMPNYYDMHGLGRGRMRIPDVPKDDLAPEHDGATDGQLRIRRGDQVLSLESDTRLPATLVIGRITHSEPHLRARLVHNVYVESMVRDEELANVLIVDPLPVPVNIAGESP